MHTKVGNLGNDLARMEVCALLSRASLEPIALASLVSNREASCAAYNRFETCWNATLIVADIERVNPNFYPQPVEDVDATVPPDLGHGSLVC